MAKGSSTILDVVVESVPQSRNVTLKKKLQQLNRVWSKNHVRMRRRLKEIENFPPYNESVELNRRISRAIDGLSVNNKRYLDKCYDYQDRGLIPKSNCIRDWYEGDWLKHLSKDTKDAIKNIEIDPLMYTDSKSDFISNYAKKLISGEYD